MDSSLPFHVFDPEADVCIVERRLPHWSQAGAISFITWRTEDSMPKAVLQAWHADRNRWLAMHGINADDPNWSSALGRLDRRLVREFLDSFSNRWHDALDACHGACALRQIGVAKIVANSLLHFDGQRYLMLDFVIMPNHVHLLASFPDEASMLNQCDSWKHYTATKINRLLGRKGRFWQQDAFDHLIRSEEQFEYLSRYIADNPRRAGLRKGEFSHYSRPR